MTIGPSLDAQARVVFARLGTRWHPPVIGPALLARCLLMVEDRTFKLDPLLAVDRRNHEAIRIVLRAHAGRRTSSWIIFEAARLA